MGGAGDPAVAGRAANVQVVRFEDVQDKASSYMDARDVLRIQRAYVFCAKSHHGQSRLSGEPYLVHPLAVAEILADMRMDPVTVVSGLLHDVLEDTDTPREELARMFGEDVAHVVDGVTKLGKLAFSSKAEAQAESFRKMLLAMADDLRVIIVKLADRLHNMRTLGFLPRAKQVDVARETVDIYAPIAHRLGMGRVKDELEDLAFRYLEPERHATLTFEIEQRRPVEEGFVRSIEERLHEVMQEAKLDVRIQARRKHLASIQRKLAARRIGIEEIYDYLAFRVLCETTADCYAALGVTHATWTPIQARFKDFIATPKPNGYRSIHTTVVSENGHPLEIQIRTHEMHRVAEEGVAAHWTYKEGGQLSPEEAERFAWLRNLVEAQQEHADPTEFMQAVRMGLYGEEVYCYTPRGDVKVLPAGATAIDFAYAVHTEIGHHCVGARIDGVLVPLRTKLAHGNLVEIVTSPSQHPSRDWLGHATTLRARSRIRQWFNARERDVAIEAGRTILEREGRRHGLTARRILLDRAAQQAWRQLGFKDGEDFLAALAHSRASPTIFFQRMGVAPLEVEKAASTSKATAPARAKASRGPVVAGDPTIETFIARCCSPIRGEAIRGYVTRGRGLSVHRVDCRSVATLAHDRERFMDAAWAPSGEGTYEARLRLDVSDRPGMLGDVTGALASMDTNIREASAKTLAAGRGAIGLRIEVADIVHLERVRRALESIDGVLAVVRW
jgi:guanosine-3',5'-bis(diphosphate) 3'-pyrophosphohydrolase